MKKNVVLILMFVLIFCSFSVLADESGAGVLSGSVWYSLDNFFEKVHLAVTFDPVKEVRLHLSYAEESLAEAFAEVENKNFKSAKKLLYNYNYEIIEAKKELKNVEGEEKTELSSELESLTSENKFTFQTLFEKVKEEEKSKQGIKKYLYNIQKR